MAALVGLRALAAPKRSLLARLVSAITLVVGTIVGASLGGSTRSAAYGVAIGMWVGVVFWWWEFHLAIRDYIAPSSLGIAVEDLVLEPDHRPSQS
jgi:hypothetical protein